MKRSLKIIGVTAIIILIAIVAIYARVPAKKTNAASGIPTASLTFAPPVNSGGNEGAYITLSSGGPFTQDIQAQICVTSNKSDDTDGVLTSGTSYPYVYCTTTPWASQTTAGSPGWSPWVGPGYDNGIWMGPTSNNEHVNLTAGYGLLSISLNTRPLPSGETLNNVVLGLTGTETNGAPYSSIGPVVPCEQAYTPAGGGTSGPLYTYVYQDCPSTWQTNPAAGSADIDAAAIGISATLVAAPGAQLSSDNIPTSFNTSETKTIGTDGNPLNIVMKNTGASTWTSDTHTIIGTPIGTCQSDSNGDGIKDAPIPNATNSGASCATSYNYSSSQFKLQHAASSFSLTPETVSYSNIVKVTNTVVYVPSEKYCAEYNSSGGNGSGPSKPSSAFRIIPQWLIKTVFASFNTNICAYWEYTDPYYYVSSSRSGSLDILPGGTATFDISSIKAPSTPGTYKETWQMEQNGNPFGSPVVISPITVGSGSGTITVTSENSQTSTMGNIPVNMKWDVLDGASDICDNGAVCSGSSQTYLNQPTGIIAMPSSSIALSNPSSPYVLNSVRLAPVAQKKNSAIDAMLVLVKDVFGSTAEAWTVPLANPLFQTLTSGGNVAFIVLWDPEANIAVNSSTAASLPLTAIAGSPASGQVQVSNDGAPGSKLTWNASSSSSWLSVSPPVDSSGLTNGSSGNASESVTINTSSSLPAGNYTGVITFKGTSSKTIPTIATLTVSLTVSPSGGGTGYNCVSNACTSVPSGAQYSSLSSCNAACGTGNPTYYTCGSGVCAATSTPGATSCAAACKTSALTATCSPASIALGQTSQCVLNLNGVPQTTATWSVMSGSTGSIGSSSGVYTPSAVGTESVSGKLPDGYSAPTTITVTASSGLPACTLGLNCPVCSPTLTATPSSIVVPESSNLSYSCRNVTECQISGALTGMFSTPTDVPASENVSTTPSVTTTYTLTCVNGNYATSTNNQAGGSATVTVSGSSFCEQNPNGVGCPGQ
jgi:hypothetical protein